MTTEPTHITKSISCTVLKEQIVFLDNEAKRLNCTRSSLIQDLIHKYELAVISLL